MDFFSPLFFGFFLIVLLVYYLVNEKYQKILILFASSVFVGSLSITFLLYTYTFILFNYLFAYLLSNKQNSKRVQKILFNTSLVFNIGSLVFFKYINFLFSSIIGLFQLFNPEISSISFKILLPLGISYYTFQGIGYLLQIYRGIEQTEKNIFVFSNYFLFFPKFMAGPIEQSKNFIPQLTKTYKFNYADIHDGLVLILWGAFKKMVIADRLAMIINGVYPNMAEMSGNLFLITFLLQPLQLYCDFSGYTDIALGIGRTFGYRLTDNFKRPFLSTSVTQFWQRWHISLSSWCNEYIFKRLTFKYRKWGVWSPAFAVFVTFFVIGIWHGPRWNFIILGILQGLAINYEFFTKRFRITQGNKIPKKLLLYGSYIIVYLFFCFTLIFFNAVKVSDSIYFITHIFKDIDLTDLSIMFLSNLDKAIVTISLLFIIVIEFRQENGKDIFAELTRWPKWTRWLFYYIMFILIVYYGSPNKAFVYMQF